ncbi:hypothetical protein ACHHYP_01147 [Achlya hypogyna]|uniref:AMP-dependent synthetase/ligase domain-containing protein n=1 Tax=Achlya hypogyna TaxID=1202772 RepID=A0A1V9Z977_ACHHY|nr:hypothetical protein ACHHYP_01147 [Achlya hypogyna]
MIIRREGRLEHLESTPPTPAAEPITVGAAKSTLLSTGTALLTKLLDAPTLFVLVVRNDLPSAAAIVAASRLQHVCVLLPASRISLLEYTIATTGAAVVVDATAGTIQRLERPKVEWPSTLRGGGVCMLTSGSTGTPKVVACTWASMLAQGDATQQCLFPTRPVRFVLASSIAHAYAINALFAILTSPYGDTSELCMAGRMDTLVPLLATPAPAFATVVFGTPGTFVPLARLSATPLHADYTYSAGVSLPTDLQALLRDNFGLTVLQNYGSTETGGIAAGGLSQLTEVHHASLPLAGALWPGTDMRVLPPAKGMVCRAGEDGELVVRTPWQCTGYVVDRALVGISADGYYRTSDGGAVVDGHAFIGERLRSPVRFRHGNFNLFVPPHEIEDAIRTHPRISDVLIPFVEAKPDRVVLLVVTTLAVHEVGAHCLATLPSFVTNLDIRKVDHLACSAAGKLLYSIAH